MRRIIQSPPQDHDPHHRPAGVAPEAANDPDPGWEPPIVRAVAVTGEGIADLGGAMQRHLDWLVASGEKRTREVARARNGFIALLRERLLAGALSRLESELGRLDAVAARIASREADPYALAAELAARLHSP